MSLQFLLHAAKNSYNEPFSYYTDTSASISTSLSRKNGKLYKISEDRRFSEVFFGLVWPWAEIWFI